MSAKKKTRLYVHGFKSIGIVDEPACEGSEIVIAKRKSEPPATILQSDATNKAELLKQSASEFDAFLATAVPKWAAGETVSKGGHMAKKTDTPPTLSDEARKGLNPEVAAYVTHLETASKAAGETVSKADHEAALAAKDQEITALTEKLQAANPAASDEEALKSLPEPARRLVIEARKKADEAQKAADREREIRETNEYVTTAKRFERVAGKAEDFGPVLRRIERNEGTAEDHKRLREILGGAEQIATDAKHWGEIGRSGDGNEGDTATEKAARRAQELVSKGEAKDLGEAYGKVFQADKALHDQYRKETAVRV